MSDTGFVDAERDKVFNLIVTGAKWVLVQSNANCTSAERISAVEENAKT